MCLMHPWRVQKGFTGCHLIALSNAALAILSLSESNSRALKSAAKRPTMLDRRIWMPWPL